MSFEYISTGHLPLAFKLKDLQVFFSDENCLKVIQSILDEKGNIINFPGCVKDERWSNEMRVGFVSDVRYEASFYCMEDGKYLMLWLIQPSGWYWVDEDGFGFTDDSPITLYTIIDKEGNFEKRFELFKVNKKKYCNEYDKYTD